MCLITTFEGLLQNMYVYYIWVSSNYLQSLKELRPVNMHSGYVADIRRLVFTVKAKLQEEGLPRGTVWLRNEGYRAENITFESCRELQDKV